MGRDGVASPQSGSQTAESAPGAGDRDVACAIELNEAHKRAARAASYFSAHFFNSLVPLLDFTSHMALFQDEVFIRAVRNNLTLVLNMPVMVVVALLLAIFLDGASSLGVFWRIMMPLSAPAVITLVVVNALWVWNELLIALVFMQKDELKTLMVGIKALRSKHYVDIPVTMAGLFIATLPIVVLYMFGQKYFIRGLVSGAVKCRR